MCEFKIQVFSLKFSVFFFLHSWEVVSMLFAGTPQGFRINQNDTQTSPTNNGTSLFTFCSFLTEWMISEMAQVIRMTQSGARNTSRINMKLKSTANKEATCSSVENTQHSAFVAPKNCANIIIISCHSLRFILSKRLKW